MLRWFPTLFFASLIGILVALPPALVRAAEKPITFACASHYAELCIAIAESWRRQHGEVQIELIQPNDLLPRVMVDLAAGRAHDVFMIESARLEEMADWLGSISSLKNVDSLTRPLAPKVLDAAQRKGRLIGLPWILDPPVIYYRADVLEKHGINVPNSFEDLVKADNRLKQAGAGSQQQGVAWSANLGSSASKDDLNAFANNDAGLMIAPMSRWSDRLNWVNPQAIKVAKLPLPPTPNKWPNFCQLCFCCNEIENVRGWYLGVSKDAITRDEVAQFLEHMTSSPDYLKELAQQSVIPANRNLMYDQRLINQFSNEDLWRSAIAPIE